MSRILCIVAILLTSCSPHVSSDDTPRIRHDKYGNSIWTSSQTNEYMLIAGYNIEIDSERRGDPVQRADPSWQAHWLTIIHGLESKGVGGAYLTDNHEQYIKYIIDKRKSVGLPDLPGYSD